jgi:hypothetical protein
MTNFEKYKDEILGISRTQAIAISKRRNAPEKCSNSVCSECLLHEGTYCNQKAIFQWLYSEYQEPAPKLTAEEYAFCKIATNGYIARNERGSLHIYSEKPVQNISGWRALNWKELNRDYFQFITWESGKAWSINDLLKLEVEG